MKRPAAEALVTRKSEYLLMRKENVFSVRIPAIR